MALTATADILRTELDQKIRMVERYRTASEPADLPTGEVLQRAYALIERFEHVEWDARIDAGVGRDGSVEFVVGFPSLIVSVFVEPDVADYSLLIEKRGYGAFNDELIEKDDLTVEQVLAEIAACAG